jgi:hypothetical protein
MDYIRVLEKHYSHCGFGIGDDYASLEWYSDEPKPTEDELNALWLSMQIDIIREERNKLLQLSDFRALPDYPNRDKWLVYRQELRDLPNNWNGVYPTAPE